MENQEQENEGQVSQAQIVSEEGSKFDQADVEKNKLIAIIGYIIPFLFFIPLVSEAKDSKYAKFHANQQLILLITAVAVNILGTIIPIIGWFIILPFGSLGLLILAIMGIINAINGEKKRLLVIGGFELIK
jgi:uncharacterized membrane protein